MSRSLVSADAGAMASETEALLRRARVLAAALEKPSVDEALRARGQRALEGLRMATHELALLELDARAVNR